MRSVEIFYKNTSVKIDMPENTYVFQYGDKSFPSIPTHKQPQGAIKQAIENPIGSEPLIDIVKKAQSIAIVFDDPVKCSGPLKTIIPYLIDILNQYGFRDDDITMMSANGVHCKWRPYEIKKHLGDAIYKRFRPCDWKECRILNHDCVKDNVNLGVTELGDDVEHDKLLINNDVIIYIGTIYAYPYGGYTGQGSTIGLASMNALRSLHSYDVYRSNNSLHGNPDPEINLYRKHKLAVHEKIEDAINKKIFYIDALVGFNENIVDVYAGCVPYLEKKEYIEADKYYKVNIPQFDIVVTGLPYKLDYDTSDNPACACNFAARPLRGWRGKPLLKKNGVLIVFAQCQGKFSSRRPGDSIAYKIYKKSYSAKEIYDYYDSFANNQTLLHDYEYSYAYSPVHSIFMMANIDTLHQMTSQAIFIGDIHPGTIREVGAIPARDFNEAIAIAKTSVGYNPDILALPRYFNDPKPIFNVS